MHHTHPTPRTRLTRGIGLGVVLTGLLASSVSAATTTVGVNDTKQFSPSSVNQTVNGRVDWDWTGVDDHSVTHDQGLFDSGLGAGLAFNRTFSAGTFAYHCEKHGPDGMRGVVRVPPQVVAKPRGLPFTVQWASARTNTGNRFDVQYRVRRGPWKTWMRGTRARSAVFGARSRPVRVLRGKTYSFRVVSSMSRTVRSATSPVKTFRAR